MKIEEAMQVLNIQQLKEVYPRIRHKVNPEIREYIDRYLEVETCIDPGQIKKSSLSWKTTSNREVMNG